GTKLQMIAVDDIGWFGARAFTDAGAVNRREIDLAGDVRTMPEAAEILTEALGRPIAFAQTPIEQVRQYSKDMALMLQWFERVGFSADIAGLEREFGRALTKLPDWARSHAPPKAAALKEVATMAMILPPSLVAYLNSEATTDVESLTNCFAADAVVHDEGRVIRGLDAIKVWKKDAKTKYQYTVKPLDAVQDQATVTMRARLTGKHPSSQNEDQ